jgi:stage IV sporulation protein FB
MLSFEPQRTAYDLHFQIAGIPVRVHPLFWLAALILGANGMWDAAGKVDPEAGMQLLIWTGVLFVSILVHELGHACVMRYFGQVPRIVLYMLGGLAIADRESGFGFRPVSRRTPQQQILISLAGPAAGFLLASLTVALLISLGGEFQFDSSRPPFFYSSVAPANASRPLVMLINGLLFLNIFWGLVNLLPVLPLDGGQVARELFEMADHRNGLVRCLWLSVITGVVVAVGGWLFLHDMFVTLLFASLAASNYMTLQQITGGGAGGRPW